jgi:lysine 6-dehydrogenase
VLREDFAYRGHLPLIRGLYDLGMFSSPKKKFGKVEITPRTVTSKLFEEHFAGDDPDIVILRVEAHKDGRVLAFSVVDHFDPDSGMTAMMRTTAWPASIVVQIMALGQIAKRGAVRSERDVPAGAFIAAMSQRGVRIEYSPSH